MLRNMFVGWSHCEAGAPEIDPKRPYGNSYVPGDIADLLNRTLSEDDDERYEQEQELMRLHRQTDTALQIVLQHGPVPGVYHRTTIYGNRWAPGALVGEIPAF